jgi:hypothetical protein
MEANRVARATLRTTFLPAFGSRLFFADLRFVAAKVAADYAELRRKKQEGTADYADGRICEEET